MSEQRPRKPLGSYWRKSNNAGSANVPVTRQHLSYGQGELVPRKPAGSYFGQPEPAPVPSIPYGSIILGLDTDTGQPVSVSQLDLCSGTYIAGVQGMGKSQLLEQVVYQQMQLDEAIIVIDPHGDLVNSIIAHMPERRLSNTYLLDLKDRAYPFGLNAFTCRNPNDEEERDTTRNQVMHAFEKLWPETREGQYFNKMLRHVIITLLENPVLTLANVRRLLLDADYRNRYTGHLKNSETRAFWQQEYNSLSESKRNTESSPLRGRLDQLLTEPVINAILKQTKKTVNIRELIEEQAILLVKLPVNEEAYKYSSPVIGTFLMSMIYAATFSFADVPLEHRPGFTLIVDEFQNFATDEYAKLFEQGRKYKVKQFLAHQHRQQLERGQTSKTNLAATLSANTIVAFRTTIPDSRELASLYLNVPRWTMSESPIFKLREHPHPLVKDFDREIVRDFREAAISAEGKSHEEAHIMDLYYRGKTAFLHPPTFQPPLQHDFGYGKMTYGSGRIRAILDKLNTLFYESEKTKQVDRRLKEAVLQAYLQIDWYEEDEIDLITMTWRHVFYYQGERRIRPPEPIPPEKIAAVKRLEKRLDAILPLLIKQPLLYHQTMLDKATDSALYLQRLEKRHALVKIGTTAYFLVTRDTRHLQTSVSAAEARARLKQVQQQTRDRYCVHRSELEEYEEKEEEAQREETEEQPPQPQPIITEAQEPEPLEVSEPEIQRPEPPQEPEQQPPEQIPASKDTMNVLYAQLRAREIDPDTTILAALGQHYVLTIKQWMRLFEWKSYPRATQYFKELKENGLIYRKDREGRGGTLAQGDWFFLLTKGANELLKRKQATPQFSLEPNEAGKASGDTLFHTYLVNELLIHLRLLERSHPDLFQIANIDHERSMRRNYLAALGTDTKLYPDGFLRLLVPTANGLKRRYLFLELQHTTQKDKHNWQTKVRKYRDLFDRPDLLEKFFSTRAPQALVITTDEAFVAYHKAWTEEVLAEAGEKGRSYSNRFLIGAYDKGINDMSMPPDQFFCTPRFYAPFQDVAYPVFEL